MNAPSSAVSSSPALSGRTVAKSLRRITSTISRRSRLTSPSPSRWISAAVRDVVVCVRRHHA
jgi:hypothetical protein